MNYLDVIFNIKQHYPEIPLSAYQVSGEYSLIKYGAKKGLIDEKKAMIESLTAIKRAGADFIISYFSKDINKLL
jgi:porphobilinogen synthase